MVDEPHSWLMPIAKTQHAHHWDEYLHELLHPLGQLIVLDSLNHLLSFLAGPDRIVTCTFGSF
jgi:hypothetical protein